MTIHRLLTRARWRPCFSLRCFATSETVSIHSVVAADGLSDFDPSRVRNFCIIAHVDHGKSTLSDRLLEATGSVGAGATAQLLDTLAVERQRGITVKAQSASMVYTRAAAGDGPFLLNLIDTPGHVDFAHEVDRALAACDGAVLLVDAAQGVQAQTLATYRAARARGLVVFAALSKVDRLGPAARERVDDAALALCEMSLIRI